MRSKLIRTAVLGCFLAAAISLAGQSVSRAQQPASVQAAQPQPTPDSNPSDASLGVTRVADQYRIGARDVLMVRVTAGKLVPELSMDSVEVDECGRIPLPSVEHEEMNEMQAAGRTRTELAENLRLFYKKYKRNPQVVVFIKEYNSQPVAINGAIMKPGQFQMRRPVRLLELVQFYAGGPTERSGGSIQLARIANFNPCTGPAADSPDFIKFEVFELKDTLAGVERANPFLQPGDVVTLPEAKEAYVVGNVLKPGPVLLKNNNVTVTQAIAMAGGYMPDSKKEKVRIIRQDADGRGRQEIFVDTKAIDSRKVADVALLPNDIVDVPTAGGKRFLRNIFSSIAPAVGQLPVRVIQ